MKPRLYLAGPGVFRPDAKAYGEKLKEICERYDCIGLFPLDQEIAKTKAEPYQVAQMIYASNIAMMDQADAIVADITPFRGPHMDPGTAFEIGYFAAKEKPIFCWTNNLNALITRMSDAVITGDGRDLTGMKIENFGLSENLMIAVPALYITREPEIAIRGAYQHFRRESFMRNARAM